MTDPLQLHALKRSLAAAMKLLDPPPAISVWAWGELRRRMGKNVTAKPGRYRTDETPYQREPQESFTDPNVQTTVLYWGKRLGKTEMINNLHGSTIEQRPCNILVVYPTLDSSTKWSKQFFVPMVNSTPVLKSRIGSAKSRDGSNTILSKQFPGGTISAIGSNSPSGFRQVQAPVVTCDEIDAMEDGPEGDPVTLAFGRAENYPDSIQVVSSTATRIFNKPTDDGGVINTGSRIHNWWLKSDQRKWFCPCPKCGFYQVLKWSQVKWPKNEKDEPIFEETYYECENGICGARLYDSERASAVLHGEWRATAPFRGIRGYWLNGINTTFPPKKGYRTKLHQMAAEFHDAYTSGESARITWKNTFLCEPHEEASERIDPDKLIEGCEPYSPQKLPNNIAVIAATVDVQGDRLECDIIGMGDEEETWAIEYAKLFGNPETRDVWRELTQHLSRTFKREDGTVLKITCTAIDLGFKSTIVKKFIKTCGLPRVYGVYGTSGKQYHLVLPKFSKHYRMETYSVNTNAAKDTIFARIKLKEHGPRFMHFPQGYGYDAEYFAGLSAEEARIRYSHGFPERFYEKIRPRNEPLDLRVYFLAAMDILKPNIKSVQASLAASQPKPEPKEYVLKPIETPQPEQPTETKTEQTKPRQPLRPRPSRGGWVGGWRR